MPDISGSWLDFVHSNRPLLPARRSPEGLVAHAGAVLRQTGDRETLIRELRTTKESGNLRRLESIERISRPDSVVVSTDLYPALFGGPSFQLLKCLTAIKLCEDLERRGLNAVPICRIRTATREDIPVGSIQLLDGQSEIRRLELTASGAGQIFAGWMPEQGQMRALLDQIEALGSDIFDPETLAILEASFATAATPAQATARLISSLLEAWGLIVLDTHAAEIQLPPGWKPAARTDEDSAGRVPESALFPVAVCVLDPFELQGFVAAQPAYASCGLIPPMAWPQASATVVDVRSRRILERYGIELHQLYAGEEEIIQSYAEAIPGGASARLLALEQETDSCIHKLNAAYHAEKRFSKTAALAGERIRFQLRRLREKRSTAGSIRLHAAGRLIRRVCNTLAPNRRSQERELAGIHLPLRYSRAIFKTLYEKLDILSTEHQLIYMD